MANIWEHPSMIAEEALTHLEDALVVAPLCAKDKTSEFNTRPNGWKVGETVSFRTHGEYAVTEFAGSITPQAISTSTRPLTIERHFDISVEVTSREATLDLDSFSEQVIQPAMYSLAESADTYLGTKILQAAGLYVSDDLFANPADIAQARKSAILQQLAMNRFCLLDLDLEAKLLGQDWFNRADSRGSAGEQTMRTADMGYAMGMGWFSSIAFPTNLTAFTAGNGTAVTNNDSGAKNLIGDKALTYDGGDAGAFNAGDRLSIAGVRRPLIVKTAVALVSGATEVELVDPIMEIIPDNAAIVVVGAGQDITYQGAIFDDRSLAVAFPMLDMPEDKVAAVATNNGISVRIVKGYDMNSKKTTLSLDFLCGAFMMDPRRVTLLGEY